MDQITADWIKGQLDLGLGTRSGLADAMGVGRDVVSKILSGKRRIKSSEIVGIREYFAGQVTLRHPAPAPSNDDENCDDVRAVTCRLTSTAPHPARNESWSRLMGSLALLTDAELDYISISAEGLFARRQQLTRS